MNKIWKELWGKVSLIAFFMGWYAVMTFIGCLLGDFMMVDCCDFFLWWMLGDFMWFFCVFLWFYVGWFFGDDGLLWFYVEWFLGRFRWNDCFKFGLQVWQVGLCKMGEPHSKYIYMRIGCRLGLIPVSAHPGLYGSRPHHAPIKRKELPTLVHGWGQLELGDHKVQHLHVDPRRANPFIIYIYYIRTT